MIVMLFFKVRWNETNSINKLVEMFLKMLHLTYIDSAIIALKWRSWLCYSTQIDGSIPFLKAQTEEVKEGVNLLFWIRIKDCITPLS